ncbi:hypothetical protein MAPG_10784 [Magnaporthiopsis poae ATCC 64411]|uniref:SET domain-containing protein n=1 Tax=Magnaporthiopsis poae (strain ATCC 64411 / 73-15) TaxID=644358 RepID=A0A0C4EDI4_MAGP6|nr:hypothetical protein MAPG_10784 [Magnaporthiopsis poae ATCC 64411]
MARHNCVQTRSYMAPGCGLASHRPSPNLAQLRQIVQQLLSTHGELLVKQVLGGMLNTFPRDCFADGSGVPPATFRAAAHGDGARLEHFYFMSLTRTEYADATKKGNLGRLWNHSCNPNCLVDKRVAGDELRMGIFALRSIKAGEELRFNYNVDGTLDHVLFVLKADGVMGHDLGVNGRVNAGMAGGCRGEQSFETNPTTSGRPPGTSPRASPRAPRPRADLDKMAASCQICRSQNITAVRSDRENPQTSRNTAQRDQGHDFTRELTRFAEDHSDFVSRQEPTTILRPPSDDPKPDFHRRLDETETRIMDKGKTAGKALTDKGFQREPSGKEGSADSANEEEEEGPCVLLRCPVATGPSYGRGPEARGGGKTRVQKRRFRVPVKPASYDYYKPQTIIPDIPTKPQWVEDGEGQVINVCWNQLTLREGADGCTMYWIRVNKHVLESHVDLAPRRPSAAEEAAARRSSGPTLSPTITLKWTYAFAYYLTRNNLTEIFEDNQKDLEMAVGRPSPEKQRRRQRHGHNDPAPGAR